MSLFLGIFGNLSTLKVPKRYNFFVFTYTDGKQPLQILSPHIIWYAHRRMNLHCTQRYLWRYCSSSSWPLPKEAHLLVRPCSASAALKSGLRWEIHALFDAIYSSASVCQISISGSDVWVGNLLCCWHRSHACSYTSDIFMYTSLSWCLIRMNHWMILINTHKQNKLYIQIVIPTGISVKFLCYITYVHHTKLV